jgi:mycothiol synthase
MPTDLGPSYTIRPPSEVDVTAILVLMRACDLADIGQADLYEAADLQNDWASLALATDAWVVTTADGTLAGYGTVTAHGPSRIFADGYVHPDHRGRGIGSALIDLSEARAAEIVAASPSGSRQVLVNTIVVGVNDARALLERRDYRLTRVYFLMDIVLEAAPPAPVWPEGIRVRTSDGGEADLRRAWETIEEGFRDHWGREPQPYESWLRRKVRDTFDPSLWFFAEDGERTAAAALCRVMESQQGWIEQLAVLRPWRRRGLALALLHHAFGEFYRRGLTRIGLAVDGQSLTGAQRLYERAGMSVTTRLGRFDKELRPGVDLATAE